MSMLPRKWAWVLGAVVLFAAGLFTAFVLLGDDPSPFPDMPAEDRAYLEWVRSIGEDEAAAVESGLKLLSESPGLNRLYLRIGELCIRQDRSSECLVAMQLIPPPTVLTALYRDAVVAELRGDSSAWKALADSPDLDAALARYFIDQLRSVREDDVLAEIEAGWQGALAEDSMLAGAAFGLGYAAILRNEWERATVYLKQAVAAAPEDAHPFREYGRMYYFTGDYDRFVEAMEHGIGNARRANDVEHEVILRGNLGLGYSQWKGDQQRAAEMFSASYAQARSLNMGRSIAIGGYRLANARARQHRYNEALALLDSVEVWYARAVPDRMSELLSLRGQILAKMYHFSEAEEAIQASLTNARAHGDRIRGAQTLLALAQLASKTGRYDQAYAAADTALGIASEYDATDFVISARSVLGEVDRLRGRYMSAENHLRAGLADAQSTANDSRVAELSRELAITALLVGDPDAAAYHFDVAHQHAGPIGVDHADALYFTANTYAYYRKYTLAARTYRRALDSIQLKNHPLSGRIKLRLAHVESALGHVESASAFVDEAADVFRRDPLQSALVHLVRGQIHLRAKDYRSALNEFEKAEASRTWLQTHWDVHYGLALSYWGLGQLDRAEAAFRKAIHDIELKREAVHSTAGRSFFVYDRNTPYDSFAIFLDEQGRIEEAIDVSERARSRGLVDLIYTTQTARGASSGETQARAIDAVVRSRALQKERLEIEESEQPDTARFAFVAEEQETLAHTYARLEQSLRGSHPLYSFAPVEVAELQAVLRPDEVVLAYSIAQPQYFDNPRSVVYVVRQDSLAAVELSLNPAGLADAVESLNRTIQETPAESGRPWADAARKLYDLLIAPARPFVGSRAAHIHFIAAGPLHYLPFAMLLDGSGRHLVETYSVSYAPSLTILKLCRDRNPRSWRRILILADPDDDLPGARHEAHLIAAMDSSAHLLAVGAQATRALLEKEAPRHDVIHLATHGRFQANAPMASHLKLWEDALTVDEIGRLKLNAYLVTLSACETALARGMQAELTTAEEWVGLHQAFLAAGTPTVVASLWTIHDRYSGPLMSRFYTMLSDKGKGVALARVQRGFIADDRTSHPFYWAGFVVIGDPL